MLTLAQMYFNLRENLFLDRHKVETVISHDHVLQLMAGRCFEAMLIEKEAFLMQQILIR